MQFHHLLLLVVKKESKVKFHEDVIMSLSPTEVRLQPYDSKWQVSFLKEREVLHEVFSDHQVIIEHVGSTAIPGLDAKPIIDIVVALEDLNDGQLYIEKLEQLNYIYKGHMGESNRYFFSKGNDEIRTHHLHVVEYGDQNWLNLTQFRDYLLEHEEVKLTYCRLKKMLAEKYPNNRLQYTLEKSTFIEHCLSND